LRSVAIEGGSQLSRDLDQSSDFLSTAPAGRRDWQMAGAVVLGSAVLFAIAVPFAQIQWPKIPAFIPVYQSAVVVTDLVTAILLFGQFNILRSWALLVLASGYLFTAGMATVHTLSFPGLFSETGLLGANSQTTAWLYMFWHGGFPLLVCGFALLSRGRESRVSFSNRTAVLGSIAIVLGAVMVVTMLATSGEAVLPAVMNGNHYTPTLVPVVATIWFLPLVGLVLLALGRPTGKLDLWLMVVMASWLFDIALSALLNAGRFDVGFYVGRAFGLIESSFVLGAMLLETNRLYSQLALTAGELRLHAGQLEQRVDERTEALGREMAERKQAQEQLFRAQKLQAVGQLTGGIAHDFNNLLGVIVGNLDLASERVGDDPRLRGPIQAAIEGAEHGAELTKRLLAFSRKQTLQLKRVAVNDLLPDTMRMLERTMGAQIAIRLRPAADLWPCMTDPVLVEDAILNLAINARDAMPGGGTLTIETGNIRLDRHYAEQEIEVTPGDYVLLSVSDTGTGMSQEILGRVFEPFFTTKDEHQGTGLGLSMVYGFVKQSKGHIKIYSEIGHGTAVKIYLPRASSEQPANIVGAARGMTIPRGSETILVVDDNSGVRAVTINQLAELGYNTIQASSASQALEMLQRHPEVSLLFSDVMMPGGMNGYELMREAKQRHPALEVLLTSGYASRSILNLPVGENPPEIINKPFRMRELAQKLRQILDTK
jgi:signal transduction histidine kinase/CheY-like chemotaxis protein